ncbi:MAG: pyridoxamine 5'-phosphate oxidase family protein [Marinomonas sp.]
MIETLSEAIAEITRQLERGASQRKSAMHTPVVATADADQRVMVLREFDAAKRRLRFHTDARSPKCGGIGDSAPVSVLFYDFDTKTQIRARGTGRIEHYGPVADAAWESSTTFARRCYLAEDAPGAVSQMGTSGLPEWAEGIQPSEDQVAPARENFAVLLVTLERLDWLYLDNSGHRRAVFTDGAEGWAGEWAVP